MAAFDIIESDWFNPNVRKKNNKINKTLATALRSDIIGQGIPTERVANVLKEYGYTNIEDLQIEDVTEFRQKIGAR